MEKKTSYSNRIYYLDIIRGLAIFFMIMQHSMLMFEYNEGDGNGIIGNIFLILGTAPAAPIFMIIMGTFIMKSRADNKTFLIRGIKLLIAGYVLNLLRFTLPLLVTGEASLAIDQLFIVDIFQLAGLFYISSILFRKIASNRYLIPIIIILILFISPYLWGITENTRVTKLLWGTGPDVSFPFFPWCIYPMIGMYLSKYIALPKINKVYKNNMLICAVILSVVGILTLEIFPYYDYSRQGFAIGSLIIAFALFYLLIFETLTARFSLDTDTKIVKTLIFWSTHLTNMYIVSWIIYGWSALVLGYNSFNDIVSMIFGFIVLLLTHILVKYTKITKLIPKI